VDAKDSKGRTPLHIACSYKYSSLGDVNPCLALLLESGANINGLDLESNSPLHYAARIQNKSTANVLINKGCDTLKTKNAKGKIPMQEGLQDFLQPLTFK
jgi:ankyrin repeat protein